MWHLHDLLATTVALAVILMVLIYGDFFDRESPAWKMLTVSIRVIGRARGRGLLRG